MSYPTPVSSYLASLFFCTFMGWAQSVQSSRAESKLCFFIDDDYQKYEKSFSIATKRDGLNRSFTVLDWKAAKIVFTGFWSCIVQMMYEFPFNERGNEASQLRVLQAKKPYFKEHNKRRLRKLLRYKFANYYSCALSKINGNLNIYSVLSSNFILLIKHDGGPSIFYGFEIHTKSTPAISKSHFFSKYYTDPIFVTKTVNFFEAVLI